MRVRVKCFSVVRETFDRDHIEVTLRDPATAADLVSAVRRLADGRLDGFPMRVARNRTFVAEDESLRATDELALIPPVQGG